MCVKEIGNLFECFPKPLEIFVHLLKALIKPLKHYEKPITSHLSVVSFCLFNSSVHFPGEGHIFYCS